MIILYFSYGPIHLLIKANNQGITNIDFVSEEETNSALQSGFSKETTQHLNHAVRELNAYFKGEIDHFTVPTDFQIGTSFQQKVWLALTRIPFGEIRSYQDIAIAVDSPKAQQAVGQANRRNPIPIIIPCHRVIGKNGQLTGYSGNSEEGLMIKQFLLDLEHKKERD